jgi:two-component system NtrC family response regulator
MDKPGILIIDDDDEVRTQMKWALAQQYNVLMAEDRQSALKQLKEHRPAVVTLDLGLPPSPGDTREGFAALADLLHSDPSLKVIVITGQGEKSNGVQAIAQGAYDFFSKPVKTEELRIVLARALKVAELQKEHREMLESGQGDSFEGILGTSRQIKTVFAAIRKMAASDASVLIAGESGTGKELVARAIHRLSARQSGPFIAIIAELSRKIFSRANSSVMKKGRSLVLTRKDKDALKLQKAELCFSTKSGNSPVPFRSNSCVSPGPRSGACRRPVADQSRYSCHCRHKCRSRKGDGGRDAFVRICIIASPCWYPCLPLREREGDLLTLAHAFLQRQAQELQKKLVLTSKSVKVIESHAVAGKRS